MLITPRCCLALAGSFFAFVLSSNGADASFEARLSRVEAALARIEARLGEVVAADELSPAVKEFRELSRQLSTKERDVNLVRVAGREEKLSVGGFLHLNGEAGGAPDARFDGVNNRFLIRRARITIRGSFAEHFDFTFQPDFGNNSTGGVTGYRAQLTDLFVSWSKYPQATLLLGQFKTPFGYEQLLGDTKVVTVERSLPNDRLTFGRQIGLGLTGAAAGNRLTYSFGIFNGNGVNNGFNDNDQMMSAARIGGVLWAAGSDNLRVGANILHSRDTGAFNGTREGRGLDAQFSRGPVELAAEYLRVDSKRALGGTTEADGWMAQATWFFVPKTWQAVARFESYDSNRRSAGNVSDSWILGFNYCIKGDDLKLSLDYHLGDPAGPLKHENRILGRMQVVF